MNVKAITFHASAVPSGNEFRPVVRIARQCADTGKTRLIGNKASAFLFPTREAAAEFAATRGESILESLRAEFPDCEFTVTRRASSPVLTLVATDAA